VSVRKSHLQRRFGVLVVLGVLLQVVHVDVGQAANQQLQFLLVENADQLARDDVVETGEKCVQLLPNSA